MSVSAQSEGPGLAVRVGREGRRGCGRVCGWGWWAMALAAASVGVSLRRWKRGFEGGAGEGLGGGVTGLRGEDTPSGNARLLIQQGADG